LKEHRKGTFKGCFSATHVTLNESDASESITCLCFESHNAHFSKTNGCFG